MFDTGVLKKIGFDIRQAELQDVDRILAIEKAVFQEPWSRFMIWEEIQRPNGDYLCAVPATVLSESSGVANAGLGRRAHVGYYDLVDPDEVFGYGSFYYFEDEGHLTNVAVAPEYRGQGIGSAIIACLLRSGIKLGVARFTLEVRRSNIQAIRIYEKFGFKLEGVRKNYYPVSGEDALIYWSPDAREPEFTQSIDQLSLMGTGVACKGAKERSQ